MIAVEVIKSKRDGQALNAEQISFFIEGYTRGEIPDYQMAALLMAIVLKGMNDQEVSLLTQSMLDSGERIHFPSSLLAVDKHSTGGVGDKTSLVLAPIVAACGVPVPMMSGRGLGHTGGTLDKLESIPGFQVGLALDDFKQQVEQLGLSFIGQTTTICPADKKIYGLRDVTGTVESLGLICASIMSKKIAEGIRGLVLDVKFGSGAFMKSLAEARALAKGLLAIGKNHGLIVQTLITDMNQPLGRFVGNALEIHECLAILQRTPCLGLPLSSFADTEDLSLELAARMIAIGTKTSLEDARRRAQQALDSGAAFEKFQRVCERQGGKLLALPKPGPFIEILAQNSGYVQEFSTEALGLAGIEIGAGREKSSDSIDPTSGFLFLKKLGEPVAKGEPLLRLFPGQAKPDRVERARARILNACKIGSQPIQAPQLIYEEIHS